MAQLWPIRGSRVHRKRPCNAQTRRNVYVQFWTLCRHCDGGHWLHWLSSHAHNATKVEKGRRLDWHRQRCRKIPRDAIVATVARISKKRQRSGLRRCCFDRTLRMRMTHQKCKDCLKFTWIKGNPPSVGWWPTKRESDVKENLNWSGTYRWWNGEYWSFPAFEHENSQKAASWASKLDKSTHRVMMWSHWPKESKC